MKWPGRPGDTFFLPTPTDRDTYARHLSIQMTAVNSSRRLVMVTVMRIKPRLEHDPACLLNVGDHPFLRQRSYASYSRMRDFDQMRLEEELE